MSDEDKSQKTEQPTGKRLSEAHSKGQVAKSTEVGHWFMLSAAALVVALFSDYVAGGLSRQIRPFFESPHAMPMDAGHLLEVFRIMGFDILKLVFLPMLLMILAAVGDNMVEHKPVLSAYRMKPELKKISPQTGVKKIFGTQGLVELAKAAFKLVVIASLLIFLVWPELQTIRLMPSYDLRHVLDIIKELALLMAAAVIGVMTVIAALDFMYQKWDFIESQKMSRQEIKDENKQSEGDPQVKARIRQVRTERARQRTMAAVPTADVLVTNPTHFAVALKYDAETMAAPRCVAKGQDLLAQKMRDIANENDVPVVENPPLARALHAGVEVDQEVPPQFYQAVAEVIGYVMGLRRKLRRPAMQG